MNTDIESAAAFAKRVHGDQRDRFSGEPYVGHLSRVADGAAVLAEAYGVDPRLAATVGWLHDAVEDTDATIDDIRKHLIVETMWPVPLIDHVCKAVGLMTKSGPGMSEPDLIAYYTAIRMHPLARVAKLADGDDNIRRLHRLTNPVDLTRLARRYSIGKDTLLS